MGEDCVHAGQEPHGTAATTGTWCWRIFLEVDDAGMVASVTPEEATIIGGRWRPAETEETEDWRRGSSTSETETESEHRHRRPKEVVVRKPKTNAREVARMRDYTATYRRGVDPEAKQADMKRAMGDGSWTRPQGWAWGEEDAYYSGEDTTIAAAEPAEIVE